MIRVILPPNLRTLAHLEGEVGLELNGTLTQRSLLDAVEAKYPMLRGTMRDHARPAAKVPKYRSVERM